MYVWKSAICFADGNLNKLKGDYSGSRVTGVIQFFINRVPFNVRYCTAMY